MTSIKPTQSKERLELIDALRGFALFGILLANLYSFIGYNTYSPNEVIALPWADRAVLFFIDWFVEGKFYSLFSILFGVGFAMQSERFQGKNENFTAFWTRRMIILFLFGQIHMLLIWNGDILTLYSILGLFLPLFIPLSNRSLLRLILILLILPLFIFTILYLTPEAAFWGSLNRLSSGLQSEWELGHLSLLELRTSDTVFEVFAINVLQSIPRAMSYLMSGRYFHVLGLFLIGVYLARVWIPKIRINEISLPNSGIWLGIVGLIFSFFYAWTKYVLGAGYALTEFGIFQAAVYHIGSTSLALGIAMVFAHWWYSGKARPIFQNLAILGRMALSNYIFQNVTAAILFFGYGFALMRQVSFASLPLFAFLILFVQLVFSREWLKGFKQGPLEYIWKVLSYRRQTRKQ